MNEDKSSVYQHKSKKKGKLTTVKKIFALLMTIMMCFSAASVVQADNNNITVSNATAALSETVYLTVALSNCDKANTLGISMEYDANVLTKVAGDCKWLKEGTIADFDEIKDKGVWAVEEKTDVNGDICKLAFRVNPDAALGKTEVTCTVIVKNDSKVIDTYSTTATVEVVKCVHIFSGEWTSKDSDVHKQACQKCGEEKTETHAWDKGVVTKDPTSTNAGMKVYTCSVCKGTKEEEIPAIGTPVTPTPDNTEKPGTTPTPDNTEKPGTTPTPDNTPIPDYTPTPDYTPVPDDDTSTSNNTQTPVSSQKPQSTPNDGDVQDSDDLEEVEVTGVKMDESAVEAKVEEIQNAEAGTELVIDMKNSDKIVATVVPVEILEAVKGKDVNVVLDMGRYSWTINGLDVVSSNLEDINLEVLLGTKAIDESVVNEVAGEDEAYQITLQHNGDFGFTASLKLNLGSENAGKFGNLYYYENGKKLVFMNAGLIDENGDVSLEFTHASDYLIVVGEERTADTIISETETVPSTEVTGTDNAEANESGKGGGGVVAIVVGLIAVIAVAVLFMKKKNK